MKDINKDKYKYNIETSDRDCPICGIFIKKGTPSHRCDEKYLEKIYKEQENKQKILEKELLKENLTYSELLDEADFLFNIYDYFDKEEED